MLVPTAGHVVIKRDKVQDKSKGGIILPDSAKAAPTTGKIVALGRRLETGDHLLIPCELNEGQTAYFERYAGHEIKLGDDELVVIKMTDIFAVVA
jgi:chaperonin GroES